MSKLILLFSLIATLGRCDILFPSEGCSEECHMFWYCDKTIDKCVYKGFFPLYPLELLEIVIVSASSALATACGIGGGTIYSAFFLGIQHFEPAVGFPISNFLILCCGTASFMTAAEDKLHHPENKFVDYDLAVIFAPSMLLGTKFGTIFNKTFSSLFLTICLMIMMCYSMNSTYRNALKAKAREQKMDEDNRRKLLKDDVIDEPVVIQPTISRLISQSSTDFRREEEIKTEIEKITTLENNPYRMDRIKFMLFLEVIIIVDQILEGNAKVPSLLGIKKCSGLFWLIFVGYIGVSFYFIHYAFQMIRDSSHRKQQLYTNYVDARMTYLNDNSFGIIIKTIFAGIVSSMVGIGGGMITNPILLGMGLDPKETSSTSTFLIMTTALASTFVYIFSGQLNVTFAVCMAIPCTLSAYYGSLKILEYMNRTKKNSILLIIMFWFLVVSMAVIIFKSYFDLKGNSDLNLFKLNSYC